MESEERTGKRANDTPELLLIYSKHDIDMLCKENMEH
jgi:hypothetical protein